MWEGDPPILLSVPLRLQRCCAGRQRPTLTAGRRCDSHPRRAKPTLPLRSRPPRARPGDSRCASSPSYHPSHHRVRTTCTARRRQITTPNTSTLRLRVENAAANGVRRRAVVERPPRRVHRTAPTSYPPHPLPPTTAPSSLMSSVPRKPRAQLLQHHPLHRLPLSALVLLLVRRDVRATLPSLQRCLRCLGYARGGQGGRGGGGGLRALTRR